jgi:hypothetical protein
VNLTNEQKLAKTEKELREILRSIECDRLFTEEGKVVEDEKKVNSFKPLSDEMESGFSSNGSSLATKRTDDIAYLFGFIR